MIVDDSDPVPPSACPLSQLGAFGKLRKLTLRALSELFGAVLSRARLSRALQDPHSKALLVLQGTAKNSPWSEFCSYPCPYLTAI